MPDISSVPVGRTGGVDVTNLALGTAALGNLFTAVAEEDSDALLRSALESGIAHIDTAPFYGVGLAEERVGRILAGVPRSSYTLSSKVGRLIHPLGPGEVVPTNEYVDTPARVSRFDLSRDGIRRSLDESLGRLGIDRIDVLYLHDPDDHEEAAHATAIPALLELRDEGLVGAVGAGMNQSEMLDRFVQAFDIDVVLLAGRYTLLDQGGLDELLPRCVERGVQVMIGGPFNSGLLANPRPGATFNYTIAAPEVVSRAKQLQAVCARYDVPLTAAAIQFPLAHPAVASVLTGARSVVELKENLASFTTEIPADLWRELRSEGLVPAHVPLPGIDEAGR